jgi:hypothetical protein
LQSQQFGFEVAAETGYLVASALAAPGLAVDQQQVVEGGDAFPEVAEALHGGPGVMQLSTASCNSLR